MFGGASVSLPDSWTLHSTMTMDEDQPFTRISVGQFMGIRSEALGSLSGDTTQRVSTSVLYTRGGYYYTWAW